MDDASPSFGRSTGGCPGDLEWAGLRFDVVGAKAGRGLTRTDADNSKGTGLCARWSEADARMTPASDMGVSDTLKLLKGRDHC